MHSPGLSEDLGDCWEKTCWGSTRNPCCNLGEVHLVFYETTSRPSMRITWRFLFYVTTSFVKISCFSLTLYKRTQYSFSQNFLSFIRGFIKKILLRYLENIWFSYTGLFIINFLNFYICAWKYTIGFYLLLI